ncbi:hypothetical protein NBRC110019_31060 [Neptunitalea chrysea]|uniref:Phytase-like domain-containing protein n=1 Tax=Neptunitalea chrysea TaxID=1647581 RepID=A0A9W6EUY3_9FLAO|nr:esterase-like activity of phytase family protein [Neptunitalea chrysea]GLB54065.1 hypothetical protein NBRC110019_31060 [Neptunitalea chrysea]
MKNISTLITILFFGLTATVFAQNTQLQFLDEYIIECGLNFNNTEIGGLSNIDYNANNSTFYFISDNRKRPRFHTATITINNSKIDTVQFQKNIYLNTKNVFLKHQKLDPESIRYIEDTNEFIISSEGNINQGINPSIIKVDSIGNMVSHFTLPDYFNANGKQHPENNGVFEGVSISFDKKGYWVSNEYPLINDPEHYTRITYYDDAAQKATKQFTYKLDSTKNFGITEILEYQPNQFLILERSYTKQEGNTIKIFDVNANKATNTLAIETLTEDDFTPAINNSEFNFNSVKGLKMDNVEGMCFGPLLPNGHQTLLLVSDSNFRCTQKTQIILMEILPM